MPFLPGASRKPRHNPHVTRVLNTLSPHEDISVLLASTLYMVNVIHKSSQAVPQGAANVKSHVDTRLLAIGRKEHRRVLVRSSTLEAARLACRMVASWLTSTISAKLNLLNAFVAFLFITSLEITDQMMYSRASEYV